MAPGRAAEIDGVVEALSAPGTVCTLAGPVGVGRSFALAAVADRLAERGVRVRRASGTPAESALSHAGLHHLLHADLERVDTFLPARQRSALLGALGYDDDLDPDPLVIATATLTALRAVAGDRPLVLVIDDLQDLDEASRAVITFVGRRLDGENLSMVLGWRGDRVPSDLTGTVLRWSTLTEQDAHDLVDALPVPPVGRVREAVLATAAGNPFVLGELAALHGDGHAEISVPWSPLAPTRRLFDRFAPDLAGLPEPERWALLRLAVLDPDADSVALHRLTSSGNWEALIRRDILVMDGGVVGFRLPILRSIVFHAATTAEVRSARRSLLASGVFGIDRAAWHSGAAADPPDVDCAVALAASATRLCAADPAAAVAAWERAAALQPDPDRAGDHLVAALSAAVGVGDVVSAQRVADLLKATDPDRGPAVLRDAEPWLDAYRGRLDAALDALLSLAGQRDRPGQRTWSAVLQAGGAAYHLGRPTARRRVAEVFDRLPRVEGDPTWEAAAALVLTISGHSPAEPVPGSAHADVAWPEWSGLCAWAADAPSAAVAVLAGRPGAGGPVALSAPTLACALFDLGRWDEAASILGLAQHLARSRGLILAEATLCTVRAQLAAARGRRREADEQAGLAATLVDPAASTALAVRVHHARGLAALADGDSAAAWTHLHRIFDPHNRPLHFHATHYGLVDLAEAAVRSAHRDDGDRLVRAAIAAVEGVPSLRVQRIHQHALALLDGESGTPDGHFRQALALVPPDREEWPFERARLLLDHGRRLRRRRRVAEAREPLQLAADEFTRLEAWPWLEAGRQELRAAGVLRWPAEAHRLDQLTGTEREVARLAASGLTNRDIGQRMFLSPRTVGSHLYRIFPKLGISTRAQLRDVDGL